MRERPACVVATRKDQQYAADESHPGQYLAAVTSAAVVPNLRYLPASGCHCALRQPARSHRPPRPSRRGSLNMLRYCCALHVCNAAAPTCAPNPIHLPPAHLCDRASVPHCLKSREDCYRAQSPTSVPHALSTTAPSPPAGVRCIQLPVLQIDQLQNHR